MPNNRDLQTNLTPFLYIPYFPDDDGKRPQTVQPTYLCPSIHLNGASHSGKAIDPNLAVELSVIVSNKGSRGATVNVNLYWSDPTTGFTTPTYICEWCFFLNGNELNHETDPPYQWIPAQEKKKIPPHFCLLAEVESVDDPSGGMYDVVNDRHYAQQNLNLLTGKPGEKISFVFHAGNPLPDKKQFLLEVLPLDGKVLDILSKAYRAEPMQIDREAVGLRRLISGEIIEPTQCFPMTLGSGEVEQFQAVITIPEALQPHQFIGAVVEQQYRLNREENTKLVVGSIGIVVFPQAI